MVVAAGMNAERRKTGRLQTILLAAASAILSLGASRIRSAACSAAEASASSSSSSPHSAAPPSGGAIEFAAACCVRRARPGARRAGSGWRRVWRPAGWLGRRCSRGKCFREQIKSEEKRGSLLVLNRAAQIRCSLFVTQLAASSANRCFGRAQQAAAAAAEKCCMQMMIVCRCLL